MLERLAALRTADPQTKRTALAAVASSGDEDLPALLLEALGDDDFGVRQEAVRLAVRCGDDEGVLAVLEAAICDEGSLARRSSAMEAFGKLGAVSVPALARLCRDPRAGVRRLAVDALGQTRALEGFAALEERTNDPAPAVRGASLEALSRLGDERSMQRVEDVVSRRDEPATVVLAGLLGLDSLGRVLPPSRVRPHLADPLTAAPALRLLGRAGDPTPLLEVLARAKGARQRAAVVGLAHSLAASPDATRAAITGAREGVLTALLQLCAEAEATTSSAALVVAATAGLYDAFAAVARRTDRGVMVTAAHRAAAALARTEPFASRRLKALAASERDNAAATFLHELAEGLRPMEDSPPALSSSTSSQPPVPAPTAPSSPFAVDRPPLQETDFARLAAVFLREAGLLFEAHAAWRLEARLAPRLKTCGVSLWSEYASLLEGRGEDARTELAAALERVTVHETYFFRERFQLDSFTNEVLPTLVGFGAKRVVPGVRRAENGTVRVLSAGCSTGEEAWTIAILLESSGLFGEKLHYEVVGIDIAPSIIEAARQARYGRRGFRGDVPPQVMERYFRDEGHNRVVTNLPDRVRFEVGNLLDPADLASAGHFDIVFCRNVLIYMSDDARVRVIRNLYDRLRPGGVLFLGHSESLLNVESGFRFLPLKRELVYLRPLDGGRRSE